ncbi:hypothetical protein ACFVYD_12535 [Streptomyces sp. NPDC058301]|uniref:hypothetical protein n=1 Tax=Streptomyces sp. NPDC058301 TaxID=3346436 RepID=UPI0036E8AFAF
MRTLMKVEMDTDKANDAIRNGTLQKTVESALEALHPEAAYFTAQNGCRTAFIVFDMTDASHMPKISEPFFMELGAKVSYTPVMNGDDLRKGLSALGH